MEERKLSYEELEARVNQLDLEVFQLKRANSKIRRLLRSERKENTALRERYKPEKQHYRNGRRDNMKGRR